MVDNQSQKMQSLHSWSESFVGKVYIAFLTKILCILQNDTCIITHM